MNRPVTPSHLMARSEQWAALERRPRRDYGIGYGGQPVTNPKQVADRDERYEPMYTAGLAHEAKQSTTNRLLELVRPGLEEVVREVVVEKGRGIDFDRHHEMQELAQAMVEALRGVLVAHFGAEDKPEEGVELEEA